MDIVSEKEEYKEQVRKLWKECFGDTNAYIDYYFKHFYCKENEVLLLTDEQKELTSMLHMNPVLFKDGNEIRKACYIAGVATKPKDRKKGYMRILMNRAFSEMKEKGYDFSLLMTENPQIYKSFGYKDISRQFYMEASYEKCGLGTPFRTHISIESMSKALNKNELEQQLENYANEYLQKKYDIYVVHDTEYFKRLYDEMKCQNGDILVIKREEKVIGYAAYVHKRFEKKLLFREMLINEEKEPAVKAAIEYYFAGLEHGAVEIKKWEKRSAPQFQVACMDEKEFLFKKFFFV